MTMHQFVARTLVIVTGMSVCSLGAAENQPARTLRELQRFKVTEAHQGVAADASSFYAITNRSIARYDRTSGKLQAKWTAPADSPVQHLNSGTVVGGKLYCANSNWPRMPLRNTLEVFEADTLRHLQRREFPETEGAINWIDRQRGAWWIVFAFYGEDVRRTRLVRYSDDWKPTGEWSFPETVIERFLPNSNSGGSFGPDGRIYVTGHDHAELYVLELPADGNSLVHVETISAPIAGQGIAWDRSDIGTLYGIIRRSREVVRMRLSHTDEYSPLRMPVEWVRDARNPILPPRTGEFDATRCMNPWVIRSGDEYHVYYAGGDSAGRHRIGVASSDVGDLGNWRRTGPLFENGPTGSFDARWCVLPHVVRVRDQWHLYYTGNAGQGSGLSAFPGIGLATSDDRESWNRRGQKPVLAPLGEHGSPDAIGIAGGSLIETELPNGSKQWRFYYTGCPTTGTPHALNQQKTICLAVSTDGITWKKHGAVMLRDPDRDYENIGVAGPVVHREDNGLYRMWYSAIGSRWGYYSICYAESDDGIHWRRGQRPEENLQLTPQGDGWEKQMVEYPSVIRENGKLRLFYCGNGYGRTGIGTAISREASSDN